MKRLSAITLLLFCLFFLAETSFAQPRFRKKYRYASVGGSVNAINYVGDLDPAPHPIAPAMRFTRLNLGATLVKRVAPRFSWRANFSWGRIKGDDVKSSTTVGDDVFRHVRNLSFRSDIWELKADFIADLFQNRRDMRKRPSYTPYVFAGIAGIKHNPKAQYNGSWVNLKPLGTEGQNLPGVGVDKQYSLFQPTIPMGIGVRYKLGDLWDLAFEIGWRWTFTDYLDDVSTNYVDRYAFSDPTARALSDRSLEGDYASRVAAYAAVSQVGMVNRVGADGATHQYVNTYGWGGGQRGDAGDKDWYVVTGFHLTYIFYPKVICPKFR